MREKNNAKGFFGLFFVIVRFLARPFARIKDVPAGYAEPCVYICRHRNMQGPVNIALNFKERFHIWSLSVFTDREACFRQYYDYTFTERYGWPRAVAYIVARLASVVVPAFNKSLRAIPVYRSSVRVIKTFRASLTALLSGESLMIFPDVDYRDDQGGEVEFYDGFLFLNRLYQDKCGKPLPFVPLYVDGERRRILMGEAVFFSEGEKAKDVIGRLIRGIDSLSKAE